MKASTAYLMLVIAAILWSLGGLFIKLVDLNPIIIAGVRSFGGCNNIFILYKKTKMVLGKIFYNGDNII